MNPFLILYVEDEDSDVFLMKHVFAKLGIKNPLQACPDGQAALDYLAGQGAYSDRIRFPVPGLVLLDLNLPMLSGIEVLAWLRQQPALRSLPVLIFSSSNRPEDIAQAYETGANGYLLKPGSLDELTALVVSLRDFWLVHNLSATALGACGLPASLPLASTLQGEQGQPASRPPVLPP